MSVSVLVVNDEPLSRSLYRFMLEPVGFDVVEAKDGRDALEIIKQKRPDAMILDVLCSDEVVAACRSLLSEEAVANLPTVILSARSHLQGFKHDLQSTVARYLPTPTPRSALICMIREALSGCEPIIV
jgi:CheY-like chemotaxis protein